MTSKADLYNSAYGNYRLDVYRDVRLETYGRDFGQTSWVTNQESEEIPTLLKLDAASHALELGCGSGRYALHLVQALRCHITAVDANRAGIDNARQLLRDESSQLLTVEHCDISQTFPFENDRFDAVFANDVLCHVPGRVRALAEILRVLRSGGRFLFSDALVIGGEVSHEELTTRSAIGFYLFSPPGHNESLIEGAGFRLLEVRDTTANAAQISKRWHDARESRRDELTSMESDANYVGLQRFLACVHKLTSERRLLRYLYLAEKPNR